MNQTPQESVYKRDTCRGCGNTELKPWFSLQEQPLANALRNQEDVKVAVKKYILSLVYCPVCKFVQLSHVVSPEVLFKDYVYFSSTSPVFRRHFEMLAEKELFYGRVKPGDLIVDIGSNDGILLQPFKDYKLRVLGIEPAKNISDYANSRLIPTWPEYFTIETAEKIIEKYGYPKLVTMTNVFAHVDDLDALMVGVKRLIEGGGRFMIEVPYLVKMLRDNTFDLIYHEHLSYFSLQSLTAFFAKYRLVIKEVEKIPVHGGSLRVYVEFAHGSEENQSVALKEDPLLFDSPLFRDFPDNIAINGVDLRYCLDTMKAKGKKIIGYGAPAKASTLLEHYNIGREYIDFIVDEAPEKHYGYMPGKDIQIVPPPKDYNYFADAILIFAWNFADSIMFKVRGQGYKGKFIIPFPKARIV